ncbi:BaiN/RdsA family NAD(P)/FAD-dependent oxidoreductase [Tuwongella immobilis]|uniref:FAD-dependent oxidoreductase 2 FAD binding domain-containing protein n=1 Tax=Tuwongella immobilis TaxID=692036 RepID=A0A6C2YK98_9BACT|nr:NAD(P)/FAD-dependent oxidoreductase [Tuwongella immobilis]VIP01533.1 HI0933 family protein OS=Pirellula staleyi (strain ATCC 27377 / DSM 6068 / ICPB 4128) GN=Psta_0791 PE=4 SV=1: HI0933_like [Tuwongella immobilis]VTR98691.1 HI0933 family protein OS=Pirellula staleyi (strain ATCC 27377 / DSM 6068 / ICPB 4128) GN=Psta_0791 PE=4 SV=1: HI0933_like [Tuwongella immobilis]
MSERPWDVLVLGGGAAGMMASIRAAEMGCRVLLIEKNKRPGVKILMSGGTRCNITHDCENRDIVTAFGPNGKFLHSALAALGTRQVVAFFEGEGVATKIEDTGKIFPVSDKAMDVLMALIHRMQRAGVTVATEESVQELTPLPEGGFTVVTSKGSYTARQVILTLGGQSYPGCGTRGDGYAIAQKLGHRIIPTRPALVPITVNTEWPGELRGITLPDVSVRVLEADKELSKRRSSLLFAHFGLSGPAALDVSRAISRHALPQSLNLEVDLLPNEKEPDIDKFLQTESLNSGKKQLAVVLATQLPRRLADAILSLLQMPADRKASGLAKADRQKLTQSIKRLRMPIRGTLGFEKAEVTAGGVALEEVDSRTMQSKIHPGLYLAGEILDVDGPIGGYNFQAAWSTGWLAGTRVAEQSRSLHDSLSRN